MDVETATHVPNHQCALSGGVVEQEAPGAHSQSQSESLYEHVAPTGRVPRNALSQKYAFATLMSIVLSQLVVALLSVARHAWASAVSKTTMHSLSS